MIVVGVNLLRHLHKIILCAILEFFVFMSDMTMTKTSLKLAATLVSCGCIHGYGCELWMNGTRKGNTSNQRYSLNSLRTKHNLEWNFLR